MISIIIMLFVLIVLSVVLNTTFLKDYVSQLGLIVTSLVCTKLIARTSLAGIGFKFSKSTVSNLVIGITLGFFAVLIYFTSYFIVVGQQYLSKLDLSRLNLMMKFSGEVLLLYVLVGLSEEMFFRGCLFSIIPSKWRFSLRNITAAFIFSIAHLGMGEYSTWVFWGILGIGIIFGILYRINGDLWLLIGFHSTWNLFMQFSAISKVDFLDMSVSMLSFTIPALLYFIIKRRIVNSMPNIQRS